MDKNVADWNLEVVATVESGNDKNVPEPMMVGTYIGCAIAVARKSGASLDNIIELLENNWNLT